MREREREGRGREREGEREIERERGGGGGGGKCACKRERTRSSCVREYRTRFDELDIVCWVLLQLVDKRYRGLHRKRRKCLMKLRPGTLSRRETGGGEVGGSKKTRTECLMKLRPGTLSREREIGGGGGRECPRKLGPRSV